MLPTGETILTTVLCMYGSTLQSKLTPRSSNMPLAGRLTQGTPRGAIFSLPPPVDETPSSYRCSAMEPESGSSETLPTYGNVHQSRCRRHGCLRRYLPT